MATQITTLIGNDCQAVDLRHTLPGAEDYTPRPLDVIKYLVVHHSATDRDLTPHEIALYHVATLGWPGIGYHFLVHQGGRIDYVGDILTIRYNVARRNHELIGVCLPGNFTYYPPLPAQLEAARHLLANLQFALGWFVPIVGHRDVALPGFATACPGDTWPDWEPQLVGEALRGLPEGGP